MPGAAGSEKLDSKSAQNEIVVVVVVVVRMHGKSAPIETLFNPLISKEIATTKILSG